MKIHDHQSWVRAFTPLAKPRARSVSTLRAFYRQVRRAAARSITPWHEQQVEGLIAQTMDEAGDTEGAAKAFRLRARHDHQHMMYYLRSTRDALKFSAELYNRIGNIKEANRLKRDVELLDTFIRSRQKSNRRSSRGA